MPKPKRHVLYVAFLWANLQLCPLWMRRLSARLSSDWRRGPDRLSGLTPRRRGSSWSRRAHVMEMGVGEVFQPRDATWPFFAVLIATRETPNDRAAVSGRGVDHEMVDAAYESGFGEMNGGGHFASHAAIWRRRESTAKAGSVEKRSRVPAARCISWIASWLLSPTSIVSLWIGCVAYVMLSLSSGAMALFFIN